MSIRRALVCSFSTPQPDRDSGSRRIFDFIRFLRDDGWSVSFVAAGKVGGRRDIARLHHYGVVVHDGETTSLRELLAGSHFDLALLAYWPIAEFYMPVIRALLPRTPVIVDSVDLHFLRLARRAAGNSAGDWGLLDQEYGLEMVGEMNAYLAADAVLTVSQKEADLINDMTGDPALASPVPDCEDLDISRVPFAKRKGILTVGSYYHSPNVQAIEYLCCEVVPRLDPAVLAKHPLYVVGNGLNQTVRNYGRGLEHVQMVGWVPSILPYFERSRISVIPLLYGAGTKRKMLQALMLGTPTVATSVGVEGLGLRDGEHVLVADDAETFARAMERLLTDETLWRSIAQAGHAHICKTHGRQVARSRFAEVVARTLAKGPKPAMLPEVGRQQFNRHMLRQYQRLLISNIQDVVHGAVPQGATVSVASDGSSELLRLPGWKARHFPQDETGAYAGYPPSADAAVAHLEALRERGTEFFLLPRSAYWWLDHYAAFRQHLEERYTVAVRREDACIIYDLREPRAVAVAITAAAEAEITPAQIEGNGEADARGGTVRVARADGNCANGQAEEGVRLIAFYLPQFHPIPENDAWWGEGFTEWANVAKAEPLFPGHYQPHLPADLGFYDLRLPEIRQQQADLARAHGIHGFCYYHYWFGGKQLLERPFDEVLSSGKPEFPFCLCWANEPWSRGWDGRKEDVLQPQTYSAEDDAAHIAWLIPALRDPRAICVEGKPLFLVYRAKDLPEPGRTAEIWRAAACEAGLNGVYLLAVETAWDTGWDATDAGFDAKVVFQPHLAALRGTLPRIGVPGKDALEVYDYEQAWPLLANLESPPCVRYAMVCPSWDNTPRMGDRGVVLHGATPAAYEQWLRDAIAKAQRRPPAERLVFINAWNEWAEGCHLEPDVCHGLAYLKATSAAVAAAGAEAAGRERSRGAL